MHRSIFGLPFPCLLQFHYLHLLLIFDRTLPQLTCGIIEGHKHGANGVNVWEVNAGDADELVQISFVTVFVDVDGFVVVHDVVVKLGQGLGFVAVDGVVRFVDVVNSAVGDFYARFADGAQTGDIEGTLICAEDEIDTIVAVVSASYLFSWVEIDLENMLDS